MTEHKHIFDTEIKRWDEGIPLGNGFLGTLIWGGTKNLRFALDRPDIWDTTPCVKEDYQEFTYENMVRLAKAGNADEFRRIFDRPYNHLVPSKLPVGALILEAPGTWKTASLDIGAAEAVIICKNADEDIALRAFVHAEKKAGLIRITGKKGTKIPCRLEYPDYGRSEQKNSGSADSVETASLKQLHYPEPERETLPENGSYFIQKITEHFAYGVFTMQKSVQTGQQEEILIVYTVGAGTDGKDWIRKSVALLDRIMEEGYCRNVTAHRKWWDAYWLKSSVNIPDAVIERNWYLSCYLLASCSRKQGYPMPLQGLWTADDGKLPPWKGDYHHDLNTELSYYHYLKANHLAEGECFLDFLWELRGQGRQFAQSFYHAKGACLPAVMTIDGQPLGGWGMYSLSPVMGAWLSQIFDRHYRYTGDEHFLRERVYPYMKDTGIFLESLLHEKDGKFYLPISSSPEIHDDTQASFLTPNSNFDLALMRFLYGRLAEYAEKLETGEEKQWRRILEKLPELAVNENKVLMLSPDESLAESHRHLSHLMAIHPLRLLKWERLEDRSIIQACIADLERLGKGGWVGYSFGWMAELYAIAKNGEGAAYQLKTFWENFCSDNGFHLNGDFKNRGITALHYRPFTLEANMCAADALQEMLLYTEDGFMELFPAIPKEWAHKGIAFERLRGENGSLITAACKDGRITALDISFTKDTGVFLCKNAYLEDASLSVKAEWKENGWLLNGKAGEHICYITGA